MDARLLRTLDVDLKGEKVLTIVGEDELAMMVQDGYAQMESTAAPRPSLSQPVENDFADGINSVGLALLNLDSPSQEVEDAEEDPPAPMEDEDEDSAELSLVTTLNRDPAWAPRGPLMQKTITLTSTDFKKIHTCKYGRSETSETLAFGTWLWRHKKIATTHDEYVKTPSETRIKHLKAALRYAGDAVQDWKNAYSSAALAGYALCRVDLGASVVVVWQPKLKGDALLFTRHDIAAPGASSDLIIEVPHPQFDHTLHQGLHVFAETRAKALLLSGSHRCSRALANKCTGNDGESIRSLCASRTVYHNSDVAHATQTMFHAAHEQLAEDNAAALFASLHATKADDFVVSDGTSGKALGPLMAFATTLALNMPERIVGLCNDFSAHASTTPANLTSVLEERRHLCGATNVQGRHLNRAEEACKAKVKRTGAELKSTGRFIHVEEPVSLVVPLDAGGKSTKPTMSKPLSDALLAAVARAAQGEGNGAPALD